MATPGQGQQLNQVQTQDKKSKRVSQRNIIIIIVIIIVAFALLGVWILGILSIIPTVWANILYAIVSVFGLVAALLTLILSSTRADKSEAEPPKQQSSTISSSASQTPSALFSSTTSPINIQLPQSDPTSEKLFLDKSSYRGIIGLPPLTDPRTIQQRKHLVEDVYRQLTQPNITSIALTGIAGIGKSTLAALIYRYEQEQRQAQASPFFAETSWLTIDPAATFADLAGTLFEALGKPLPDMSKLAPQNQAVALFNALDTADKPHLIVLDQFENLLNWDTGHALADRPGVGEWLDILNNKKCVCRILMTSRPRPIGTRDYPPTYLQEYPVGGLTVKEGIALLRKQGVQGTEMELEAAVSHSTGHAFSLTLFASLIRDYHINLSTLLKDSALWIGDIATNLLDQIYTRLSNIQRELLRAFSVYREPVPLEAVQVIISSVAKEKISYALKALLIQHLLEAVGEDRYQLHAIVAEYTRAHFDESSDFANEGAQSAAHAKAAQYYQQRAKTSCPPRDRRKGISDVHGHVEAIWQYCQAKLWEKAYNLMEQEGIFEDVHRWGGDAVLLELYQLMIALWQPNQSQKAHVYNNIGDIYRFLGQNNQAIEYLEQSLNICQELGDIKGEGRALNSLGRTYAPLGNKIQAKEYFERALKIYNKLGQLEGEGIALVNLGWVYSDLGQMDQAQRYFEQALRILINAGDRGGEARAYYSLGQVHIVFYETEAARRCYEKALQISKEVGDRGTEGIAIRGLSRVYNYLGQNDLALKSAEDALKISIEVGELDRVGWAYDELGRAYEIFQNWEAALMHYQQALNLLKEVGDQRGEARALYHIGWLYSRLGQKEEAKRYSLKGLRTVRKVTDRRGEAEALYQLGLLYYEQGSYEVALAFFLLASSFFRELKGPYFKETQKSSDRLREIIGDKQFTELKAKVEPQASQIVEEELCNDLG